MGLFVAIEQVRGSNSEDRGHPTPLFGSAKAKQKSRDDQEEEMRSLQLLLVLGLAFAVQSADPIRVRK